MRLSWLRRLANGAGLRSPYCSCRQLLYGGPNLTRLRFTTPALLLVLSRLSQFTTCVQIGKPSSRAEPLCAPNPLTLNYIFEKEKKNEQSFAYPPGLSLHHTLSGDQG